jgi:hypothetical protein
VEVDGLKQLSFLVDDGDWHKKQALQPIFISASPEKYEHERHIKFLLTIDIYRY